MPSIYDAVLEDRTVAGEEVSEPCPVDLDRIERDPRKVTLFCDCGEQATYTLRTAGRLIALCQSSHCFRDGLGQAERWYKASKNKAIELIVSNHDVLDPPPWVPVKEEIAKFQREHKLEVTGRIDEPTIEALRRQGRAGMIPLWWARQENEG